MNLSEQIKSLYDAGYSQRGVAQMLDIKPNYVQRTLAKLNLNRSHSESITLWHSQRRAAGIPGPNQVKTKAMGMAPAH